MATKPDAATEVLHAQYRTAAKILHDVADQVEVEMSGPVSEVTGGAWVRAWVFVPAAEVGK